MTKIILDFRYSGLAIALFMPVSSILGCILIASFFFALDEMLIYQCACLGCLLSLLSMKLPTLPQKEFIVIINPTKR